MSPYTNELTSARARALDAADVAAEWLFGEPMSGILQVFGETMPNPALSGYAATNWQSWLHLNDELPAWFAGFSNSEAMTVDSNTSRLLHLVVRTVALEQIAARHFNFRSLDGTTYKERSQAIKGDLDERARGRIGRHASELNLLGQQLPKHSHYDYLLVMGGGYISPLRRAEYASELLSRVTVGHIDLLGSPRFLIDEPPEAEAVENYAPAAKDEFDLMVGAARVALHLQATDTRFLCGCQSATAVCPLWTARRSDLALVEGTPPEFTHERAAVVTDTKGRPTGHVLSASTGRPPYRPDTADTYALWARETHPKGRSTVLAVTTQVFVPFQTFDALRLLALPHGIDVEVVGFDGRGDRPSNAEFLLQEMLSAIRSARRLLTAVTETVVSPSLLAAMANPDTHAQSPRGQST